MFITNQRETMMFNSKNIDKIWVEEDSGKGYCMVRYLQKTYCFAAYDTYEEAKKEIAVLAEAFAAGMGGFTFYPIGRTEEDSI